MKVPMRIIMYTKTGCPWCAGVRELLNKHKVPFEERNVMDHEHFYAELTSKSGQTLTPTLDIDGEILSDSDADQVSAYLKRRGVAGFK